MALPAGSVTPDTLITIKVSYNSVLKKVKLPLKDLTANVLTDKLRNALNIPATRTVTFERFSDSAGGFIVLDKSNVPVYKALVRAAKAKGKLRLRVTVAEDKEIMETPVEQAIRASMLPQSTIPQQFSCVKSRMSGAGIFDYRATQSTQPSPVVQLAPVPQPFTLDEMPKLAPASTAAAFTALLDTPATAAPAVHSTAAWSVYCNSCDIAMSDTHWHCSMCDGGDYDLCEKCIVEGKLCAGEGHWLIKRYIRNGQFVTSTTELAKPAGADVQISEPTRTCNSCVVILPERHFVTCIDCEEFDLCIPCHVKNAHGHSAAHTFQPSTKDTALPLLAQNLLQAGRNVAHNAFCDVCDNKIYGIRHKCLNCPDWDMCSSCHVDAARLHPRHRFAPIYEQLADPVTNLARHTGVYCDGPLCSAHKTQTYITGDRYKCAVCHDTDFCANCEASPSNTHNRTHPMIKLRTPVRNVSIQTTNQDLHGHVRNMGDRRAGPDVATSASQAASDAVNTATAVQTVLEIPPTEEKKVERVVQPEDGDVAMPTTAKAQASPVVPTALLNAAFVRDSVLDGTTMSSGAVFTQVWTLRNEGPHVWPAGCSIRYVGGDNMLNVDSFHPASCTDIARATESSIVAREVQVGEEVSFRITLRAPARLGKSISYWRLKAPDGTAFGHRLWCDIDVRTVPITGDTIAKFLEPPVSPNRMSTRARRTTQEYNQACRYAQQLASFHPSTTPELKPVLPSMKLPLRPAAHASQADQERVIAAKARVDAIKLRIIRYRAENSHAHALMKNQTVADRADAEVKPTTEPSAIVSPPAVAPTEAHIEAASASSSLMVFPKLEKESPASSIIVGKPAYVQSEDGSVEQSAALDEDVDEEEASDAALEDFDDLEVVSAGVVSDANDDDAEEDLDDGFLTDEEYDILDASDRETVASP